MQTTASDHRWLALLFLAVLPGVWALRKAWPDMPNRLAPILSLLGGACTGVGHAIWTGVDPEQALFSALIGMAGGGTSVALYEATKKRVPGAPPSGGDAPMGQDGPATPKSPRGGDELTRLTWAACLLVAWTLCGTCLACSASDRARATRIADGAVPACEVGMVVLADAPELKGLCVSADELLDAFLEEQGAGPVKPTKAAVHRRLHKRRAVQVDGGVK